MLQKDVILALIQKDTISVDVGGDKIIGNNTDLSDGAGEVVLLGHPPFKTP